jgi:Na+-translocating ferredoxin:NAD+ oxidoreductase RnfD subunit
MPLNSPFIRKGSRSSPMAAWAFLALLVPCSIYSILYKSPFVWHVMGYGLLGMAAESIYTLIVKRERRLVCMGSAFSAALLAASLPPTMPFLPMLFAILLMVWIVKLPMVGLPLRFNAAMAGRFFLMKFYNADTVAWGTPTADVISTATPQELYRDEGAMLEWTELLFGRIDGIWEELFQLVPGSPGETFPLIILLLGLVLSIKRIVAWRTGLAFLFSFAAMTWLLGSHPLYNLLSAATIFSAVFIVSDPVSTPMTNSCKIICGVIIGVSNALIRHFTFYTEAIVYAVLFGNLCALFLDRIAFQLRGLKLYKRMS